MTNNLHTQRGTISIPVAGTLVLFALVIFIAARLAPLYLDNSAVKLMLTNLESNKTLEFHSPTEVRERIMKQLQINMVKHVKIEDVSVVRAPNAFDVDITYQVQLPLAYNVEMLVSFSEQAEIPFN